MFSRCEAGVGGVSTLLFSFTRLAPPPTHNLDKPSRVLSFILREKRPGATLQHCCFGLAIAAKGCLCLYSPNCLEEKFSEPEIPVYGILGNSICATTYSLKPYM